MIALNFPQYRFRIKNSENSTLIFDGIRKKFVVLTPEEWVRQHVLNYLFQDRHFPKSLINVEKQLVINGLKKRYDVVVFNPLGNIHLLIECKAPHIALDQTAFDQLARYNLAMNAKYLMVTNGLQHYCCSILPEQEKYEFIREIPEFNR